MPDEAQVASFLRTANYYRFSGYAREYQMRPTGGDESFASGTCFDDVVGAMRADERLSQLLLRSLLRVERSIRGHLAYELAMLHGETAFYLSPDAYIASVGKGAEITEGIEARLRKSKHRGVRRYLNGSDCSAIPIWVGVEEITFGTLAQLVTHLDDRSAVDVVADSLGIKRAQFPSVVAAFSYLRNSCAHHSQLWHRYATATAPLVIKPAHKRYHPRWAPTSFYSTAIALSAVLATIATPEDPARIAITDAMDYLKSEDRYVEGFLRPAPR